MDPWQMALERFRRSLTEEEKKLFANSKPEDILQDVRNYEVRSSGVRAFSGRLQPLLDAIGHYGIALDVIPNSYSLILCPLWGSLRVLLRAAQQYNRYYSGILEMLERITDLLPRYSTYSDLFSRHAPLQTALSAAYLEIITFLTLAKGILSKPFFRVLSMILWKPFEKPFEASVLKLRRCRELVEDEARLANMIELREERIQAQELRVQMNQERLSAAESRKRLDELKSIVETREQGCPRCYSAPDLPLTKAVTSLAEIGRWLNARQCHVERASIIENRLPGSCSWILQRQELPTWISDEQAQIFWIHGPPGCGKSFLYSKLLDHLGDRDPLAYFLFCGADKERTLFSSLVRSWSLQLIQQIPDATQFLDAVRDIDKSRVATRAEVLELFLLVLEHSNARFLTVDALDECSDRENFFRFLLKIPKRFKVLILSRKTADIQRELSQYPGGLITLSIQPDFTKADIDCFITKKLDAQDPPYGTETREIIRQRLTDCNGMFLWVSLMFEHLRSQTCEFEIRNCLNELPTGLNDTYDRIFKRINSLHDPERRLAHKVFFWVIAARCPISVPEMSCLLAIQPTANTFDEGRLVGNLESKIPSVCFSLVQVRYDEKKLYPAHFTVTQYLEQYLERSETLQKLTSYYDARGLKSSDNLAAAICIRYLSLAFITALQKPRNSHEVSELLNNQEPRFGLLRYAALHWFEHLRDVENPEPLVLDLARRFLDRAFPNLEICWLIHWFSGPGSGGSTVCPHFSSVDVSDYFGLQGVIQE